jgi:gamma-glutamylcyclotransferase (GGCT)/AIG2-like uncharacterized protein YtfP
LVGYKVRIPCELAKSEKPVNCVDIEITMEFLFVYGTLLNPENPVGHFLHSNAEFYANGFFLGKLFDLGNYPGAVESNNPEDKVYGSVFQIRNPEIVFQVLDDYEEVGDKFSTPNEYARKRIKVFTTNNETRNCHVYLYNHPVDSGNQIVSGTFTPETD